MKRLTKKYILALNKGWGKEYAGRQKIIITAGAIDLSILDNEGNELYRGLLPTISLLKRLKNGKTN